MGLDAEVSPLAVEGWSMSLLGFFGAGPKWTISCGGCGAVFKQRLDMETTVQRLRCPHCAAVNRFTVEIETG